MVFAMKDIIFFIFLEKRSPVSCQIYRSFSDLITFFLSQGKNVKNGIRK